LQRPGADLITAGVSRAGAAVSAALQWQGLGGSAPPIPPPAPKAYSRLLRSAGKLQKRLGEDPSYRNSTKSHAAAAAAATALGACSETDPAARDFVAGTSSRQCQNTARTAPGHRRDAARTPSGHRRGTASPLAAAAQAFFAAARFVAVRLKPPARLLPAPVLGAVRLRSREQPRRGRPARPPPSQSLRRRDEAKRSPKHPKTWNDGVKQAGARASPSPWASSACACLGRWGVPAFWGNRALLPFPRRRFPCPGMVGQAQGQPPGCGSPARSSPGGRLADIGHRWGEAPLKRSQKCNRKFSFCPSSSSALQQRRRGDAEQEPAGQF